MKFIPGLELSQMLYEEEIKLIMEARFNRVKYAAATLGMCSESLGLDDEVSMDHMWGPRIFIFVSEDDFSSSSKDIMQAFRELLPTQFKGFDMMWLEPGADVVSTKTVKLYTIGVATIRLLLHSFGIAALPPKDDADWLKMSEQRLLEFTAGKIYRDDSGELTKARELLKYYPDNVLRFLLMHEWQHVAGSWRYLGRMGPREDKLGVRIQAAKAAHHLMRIAFMINRRYFPYTKWFGTLFKDLPVAGELGPILIALLAEMKWQSVDEKICEAASLLLKQQNALKITSEISIKAKAAKDDPYHAQFNFEDADRYHMKFDFDRLANQIADDIQPPLGSLIENQLPDRDHKRQIMENLEVGKWPIFLQK